MASSKWAFCFTLTIAVCLSLTAAITKDPKAAMFLGGRGGAFGIWSKPEVLAMEPAAAYDSASPPDVMAMEPAATSDRASPPDVMAMEPAAASDSASPPDVMAMEPASASDLEAIGLSMADFGVVSEPYAYQMDVEVVSEPYAYQTEMNRDADDSKEALKHNHGKPISIN